MVKQFVVQFACQCDDQRQGDQRCSPDNGITEPAGYVNAVVAYVVRVQAIAVPRVAVDLEHPEQQPENPQRDCRERRRTEVKPTHERVLCENTE
ncbi:hypothetical protein D3C85_1213110 [compost metagenome]